LESRGVRIEAQHAQRRRAFLARRYIDGQTSHDDAPLASAQVREPDQAEAEHGRRVGIRRTGDRRPSVLPMLQVRAWKRRGETVLEIGLRADLREMPFRKLPPQEEPEALAEHQPSAFLAELRAALARQIEQKHLTLAPRE